MREKWARRIVLFTGLLVLLLASLFALIQNPVDTTEMTKSRQSMATNTLTKSINSNKPNLVKAGQQIYQQQGCASCHSIAKQGNPRNPLDDVGTQHTTDELRNLIIGADAIKDQLPKGIRSMKQKYKKLSDDDLNALVVYIQSLRL